jgi:hypothetical protein
VNRRQGKNLGSFGIVLGVNPLEVNGLFGPYDPLFVAHPPERKAKTGAFVDPMWRSLEEIHKKGLTRAIVL